MPPVLAGNAVADALVVLAEAKAARSRRRTAKKSLAVAKASITTSAPGCREGAAEAVGEGGFRLFHGHGHGDAFAGGVRPSALTTIDSADAAQISARALARSPEAAVAAVGMSYLAQMSL